MFERFTTGARSTVIRAQEAARGSEDTDIRTHHLLRALSSGTGAAARVLAEYRLGPSQVDDELARVGRRGGVTDEDFAALQELGIDVDAVVRKIESTHGENALVGREKYRARRRRAHLPFADEAKRALELSLREAVSLGDGYIGEEHLLLALLKAPGLAADVMTAHGMRYPEIREAVAARRAS